MPIKPLRDEPDAVPGVEPRMQRAQLRRHCGWRHIEPEEVARDVEQARAARGIGLHGGPRMPAPATIGTRPCLRLAPLAARRIQRGLDQLPLLLERELVELPEPVRVRAIPLEVDHSQGGRLQVELGD